MLAGACLENEWEEKEQNEKEIIDTYLGENGITEEQKTTGGIYFIEAFAGTGLTPQKDNYVIINYTGRYLEDGSIHETSFDTLKDDWENADVYKYFVYGPLKFQYGYSISGINEGLALMKEGGKAELVIPSDKAFYDFNPLVYEVELLKVIRNPVTYEDSVLNIYIAEKGYDSTTVYKDIYFKETVTPNPSDERTVQQGDTILFRFAGKLVDGFGLIIQDNRIFDGNMDDTNPVKYVYGKSDLISGFMLAFPVGLKSALDTMREGTHATAVLPYEQAFGDKGLFNSTYGYTIVPKFQTVVYDIILEEIRPPSE
jgi:FKBP-type peptidyl-prolyl cis-trans isomerase